MQSTPLPTSPQSFVVFASAYKGNGCLLWPFTKTGSGYGWLRLSNPRRGAMAHVVVCSAVHDAKISGIHEVGHSCGNKLCLNPAHLRWCLHVDNCADRKAHGTHLEGERVPHARLTEKQVSFIRASSLMQKELAAQFGCDPSNISAIKRRRSWKHLS